MQQLEQKLVRALESAGAPHPTAETVSMYGRLDHVEDETFAPHASQHETRGGYCKVSQDGDNTIFTWHYPPRDPSSRFIIDLHGIRVTLFMYNKSTRGATLLRGVEGESSTIKTQLAAGNEIKLEVALEHLPFDPTQPHGWAVLKCRKGKPSTIVESVVVTVKTAFLIEDLNNLAK